MRQKSIAGCYQNNVAWLYGEKSIRNNDFISRVKDEFEGETYEIFVGQKNGADIEIIHMTLKQALRVAARESKAVRRSLIDKLEQQSTPQSPNEIIAAMALANVAQERRLKSVETQVEQVAEEIDHIKQGTIPAGYQGYSYLQATYGLSIAKRHYFDNSQLYFFAVYHGISCNRF